MTPETQDFCAVFNSELNGWDIYRKSGTHLQKTKSFVHAQAGEARVIEAMERMQAAVEAPKEAA